jgi:hypothetical protein
MSGDPYLFGACPTCGTITIPPAEIAEARPFIGIPIPTSEEIDTKSQYEGLLLLEPRSMYDQCIVGVVRRFADRFVLYSEECVISQLMTEDPDGPEVPYEDRDAHARAWEWYEYNMVGAFVGEHTPGFLEDVTDD